MVKLDPIRPRSLTSFLRHGQGANTQVNGGNLSLGIEMSQIFGADSGSTTGIQNADILAIGFATGAKAIGRQPIPSPVVTGWRLVQ
jgi:hypothetical protein